MQKRVTTILLILVVGSIILAGCDQNDSTPEELPTLAPGVGNPTPTQEDADLETVDVSPSPTERPRERPTLPPTWTSTPPPPTVTPTETAVIEPTVEIVNPPAACNDFGVDTSNLDEQFPLGSSPTVAWRAVEGVELYWLVVLDNFSNQIHEHYTSELSYDIPADVFPAAMRYGWEIRPLDPFGIQMCPSQGGALFARP